MNKTGSSAILYILSKASDSAPHPRAAVTEYPLESA